MKESPFVEQMIIIGAEQKFVGALIVPSFPSLQEWMRHKDIPFTTPEDALHNPKVLALYRELIDSFNKFFNHVEQVKKFDKELRYIQKWVPNFQEIDYPAPMIDHKKARERCLMVYKTALSTL